MYQVVPQLAGWYTTRGSSSLYPRCLCWIVDTSNVVYSNIQSELGEDNENGIKLDNARTILRPDEREMPLMDGCRYTHESPDLLFDKAVKEYEEEHPQASLSQSQSWARTRGSQAAGSEDNMEKRLLAKMEEILKRLSGLKKAVEDIKRGLRKERNEEDEDVVSLGSARTSRDKGPRKGRKVADKDVLSVGAASNETVNGAEDNEVDDKQEPDKDDEDKPEPSNEDKDKEGTEGGQKSDKAVGGQENDDIAATKVGPEGSMEPTMEEDAGAEEKVEDQGRPKRARRPPSSLEGHDVAQVAKKP